MAKPTVLVEDFADMLGFDAPAPQAEPIVSPVQSGLTEMDFSIPSRSFTSTCKESDSPVIKRRISEANVAAMPFPPFPCQKILNS